MLNKIFSKILILFALLLHVSIPLQSFPAETISEYKLKSALIYNFLKFAEWPNSGKETINFCIIGEDPFGKELLPIEKKRIGDRSIKLLSDTKVGGIDNCSAIFIGESEIGTIKILELVNMKPILTIGEMDGFAKMGGMIQFSKKETKIEFIINKKSVDKSGLKLSSKLLELGSVIE